MVRSLGLLVFLAAAAAPAAQKASVEGSFVIDGGDAGLAHVRAARVPLDDEGKTGYAVLLTERPAEGPIEGWRTAQPSERGGFVHLLFEADGSLWVAELGHPRARSGRFGVVTEVEKVAFEVRDGRLAGHVRTPGEQVFTEDRYTLDLKFEAPLED